MTDLKRAILIAAACGAGVVVGAGALFMGWHWYGSRPRPWDKSVVTAEFDSSDVEGETGTMVFSYTLYNHSARDYRLDSPAGITVAGRRDRQHDLSVGPETTIRLDYPVLVPPQERARVAIHLAYSCPGLLLEPDLNPDTRAANRATNRERIAKCLKEEFGNLAGFVLFDDREHVQIEFPRPK